MAKAFKKAAYCVESWASYDTDFSWRRYIELKQKKFFKITKIRLYRLQMHMVSLKIYAKSVNLMDDNRLELICILDW